jgi:hypothetical protein
MCAARWRQQVLTYSGRAELVALQGIGNVALEWRRGQLIRRRNLFNNV